MNLTKVQRELRKGGLRYWAFISYPNTDADMRRLSFAFRDHLDSILRQNLPLLAKPSDNVVLFHDATEIRVGTEWEMKLAAAVRESVCLIALCVPNYANSDWCGREYGGMRALNRPILPVRLGEEVPHKEITRLQVFDLSKRLICDVEKDPLFNQCIRILYREVRDAGCSLARAGIAPVDPLAYRLPRSYFKRQRTPALISRKP